MRAGTDDTNAIGIKLNNNFRVNPVYIESGREENLRSSWLNQPPTVKFLNQKVKQAIKKSREYQIISPQKKEIEKNK